MNVIKLYTVFFDKLSAYTSDVFLLFLRLYVGYIYFISGYFKITSWDSTLYLFEEEYVVPLLNFQVAAVLGTALELVLPILLIFGFATRLSALALFVFNILAVLSYPILTEKGFEWFAPVLVDGRLYGAIDHQIWGLMLLIVVIFGSGKIAIDNLICKLYCNK